MRIRLLLLQFLLHGIFCVSERHAAALCLRIYRFSGASPALQADFALITVFCLRRLPFIFIELKRGVYFPFLFPLFSDMLSFSFFIRLFHCYIGAYADLSLFSAPG